eukprot:2126322-Rhodomonas_salina.1
MRTALHLPEQTLGLVNGARNGIKPGSELFARPGLRRSTVRDHQRCNWLARSVRSLENLQHLVQLLQDHAPITGNDLGHVEHLDNVPPSVLRKTDDPI